MEAAADWLVSLHAARLDVDAEASADDELLRNYGDWLDRHPQNIAAAARMLVLWELLGEALSSCSERAPGGRQAGPWDDGSG